MIILFGFRRFRTQLGIVTLTCRNGQHAAAHRVVKTARWFTLFFIPMIPLGRQYWMICAGCGLQSRISEADATAYAEGRIGSSATALPTGPATPWTPVDLAGASPGAGAPPSGTWSAPTGGDGLASPAHSGGPPAPATQGPGPAVERGWYPDPAGGSGLRWWDGSRWTADTHPQA